MRISGCTRAALFPPALSNRPSRIPPGLDWWSGLQSAQPEAEDWLNGPSDVPSSDFMQLNSNVLSFAAQASPRIAPLG